MRGLNFKEARRLAKISAVAVSVALLAGIAAWAVDKTHTHKAEDDSAYAREVTVIDDNQTPETDSVVTRENDAISALFATGSNRHRKHIGYMPDGGVRLKVRPVGPPRVEFNDSNYVHLSSATLVGIEPITSLRKAWQTRQPVVKVESCQDYFVDTLTHSIPFLVPRAETLLHDIGRAFRDSLQARGGGDYRIKVTSLLRTPKTISRLRRRNRNATDSSAHQYGTTFDISYVKFICDSPKVPRSAVDLKGLLAEILSDMRSDGRCYVKYERRQACFHITTR